MVRIGVGVVMVSRVNLASQWLAAGKRPLRPETLRNWRLAGCNLPLIAVILLQSYSLGLLLQFPRPPNLV